MKQLRFIIVLLLTLSISLSAQSLRQTDLGSSGDAIGESRMENKFSLFDLSRLEMHHSYSVSYFSSGGHGTTIGMYINSIRYRISNPLTLNVSLAWMHQPGNLLSQDRGTPTDYGSIYPVSAWNIVPPAVFFCRWNIARIPHIPIAETTAMTQWVIGTDFSAKIIKCCEKRIKKFHEAKNIV